MGMCFVDWERKIGDIEFRNRTKLPELMLKFEFVKDLYKDFRRELKDCDFEENQEEEEEFE